MKDFTADKQLIHDLAAIDWFLVGGVYDQNSNRTAPHIFATQLLVDDPGINPHDRTLGFEAFDK